MAVQWYYREAEFGETKMIDHFAASVTDVASVDPSTEMGFYKLGVVALLRSSDMGTFDVCRRLRCALSKVVDKDNSLYVLVAAYQEEAHENDLWTTVARVLQRLPLSPQNEPSNLAAYLVSYPQHGSVIVNGARNSLSLHSQHVQSLKSLRAVRDALVKMAANSAVDFGVANACLLEVLEWYKRTPPAFFESFLYDQPCENELGKTLLKVLKSLAYSAILEIFERAIACIETWKAKAPVAFDDSEIEELFSFDRGMEIVGLVSRWQGAAQEYEIALATALRWKEFCEAGISSARVKCVYELGDFSHVSAIATGPLHDVITTLRALYVDYVQPTAYSQLQEQVKAPLLELDSAFRKASLSVEHDGDPPFLLSECPPPEVTVDLVEQLSSVNKTMQKKADFAGRYINLVARTQHMTKQAFDTISNDTLSLYSDFSKCIGNMRLFVEGHCVEGDSAINININTKY